MDYETETRSAYQSRDRAAAYKRYHTSDWSWGRIATRLERRALRRLLRARAWTSSDLILDVPCGTGILGPLLGELSAGVVASDIAFEMMALAGDEYARSQLRGFVQADITATPFRDRRFAGLVVLGFMHRVPSEIRRRALAELHRICGDLAIVSFSFTSGAQRLKQSLLKALKPGHIPAPHAAPVDVVEREIADAGFQVARRVQIAPFLSAESLYVLRRGRA